MQAVNKRHSLYVQLLLLLLAAALISTGVFFVLNRIGTSAVGIYSENTDYSQRQDEKYIEKLQTYVTENSLSMFDRASLDAWVEKQRILYLRMYIQGFLIYDSGYASDEEELSDFFSDSTEYTVSNYYSVQFSDGTAMVVILGLYDYQLSTWAFVAELAAAILLFFLIVLLGIRSKMNYILTLGKEIEILEGGKLDYPVTVKGKDELAGLARGLDNMRISFAKQLEHEAAMDSENKRAVTEMSHDLRTPLTSIMLYTELLKQGKYADEAQMQDYLDKIDKKAHQMRHMTENLFKYTLVTGEEKEPETALEEPAEFKAVFYDPLSETLSALAQMGFETSCDFAWPHGTLRVNTDYVMRILDNIVSNIQKYADPGAPVVISVIHEEKSMLGFRFENRTRSAPANTESTGVGLRSIRAMMEKMGGSCESGEVAENTFRIELLFPCTKGVED